MRVKMKNKLLGALLLTIMISGIAYSAPTIYGPSGLITIPTAEALKYKEFNIGMDNKINGSTATNEWYYKANLGTFKGCELGVVGGAVPTEGVYLNVKYYLMSNNERFPLSIAIGAENLASLYRTAVYMVATQRFEGGLIGSVGFRANFGEDELDPSLMGGLEYMVSDSVSILGDFLGERKLYMLNAGIRVALNNDILMRMYIYDLGQNRDEVYYSLGISYAKFL
jgi:hypothetical protein